MRKVNPRSTALHALGGQVAGRHHARAASPNAPSKMAEELPRSIALRATGATSWPDGHHARACSPNAPSRSGGRPSQHCASCAGGQVAGRHHARAAHRTRRPGCGRLTLAALRLRRWRTTGPDNTTRRAARKMPAHCRESLLFRRARAQHFQIPAELYSQKISTESLPYPRSDQSLSSARHIERAAKIASVPADKIEETVRSLSLTWVGTFRRSGGLTASSRIYLTINRIVDDARNSGRRNKVR